VDVQNDLAYSFVSLVPDRQSREYDSVAVGGSIRSSKPEEMRNEKVVIMIKPKEAFSPGLLKPTRVANRCDQARQAVHDLRHKLCYEHFKIAARRAPDPWAVTLSSVSR
jgi:hypothetical protein